MIAARGILSVCLYVYASVITDLYIYTLDAVPPIYVVSNDVATDKLTTQNGGMFTYWADQAELVSVANHVKARQSLMQAVWTGQNLTDYRFTYFCILYVRIK